MKRLILTRPDRTLRAEVALDGSKSISNRALIVLALAGADPAPWLKNCSTSKDTVTLQRLLAQRDSDIFDAGDAGTTFRFLTAYLAMQPGTQILTGSARMRERPVGALVHALRALGADIRFMEKDGYPPLEIGDAGAIGRNGNSIRIEAGVSSQFLSALAMIGPYLPEGLVIVPEGPLVSRPYLEMTVQLMRHFGAEAQWRGDNLHVLPGAYTARPFTVEADWSAASYWYALAAFSDELDLRLKGLYSNSWQGDAVLATMMIQLGIETRFEAEGIHLVRSGQAPKEQFERDFIECPDIAQTLAVICAGLGVRGLFCGLETLSVKETDRILALKNELAKVGVGFSKLPPRFSPKNPEKTYYLLDGKAQVAGPPQFATYGDHRMAMSFAPLCSFAPVLIEHPEVVSKSYPQFWEHLRLAGVEMNNV